MLPALKVYITQDDTKYLLFEQSEVISDEIRNNGVWNLPCLDLCDKVLSKHIDGRVIDVGAGFGSFSIPLSIKHGDRFVFSAYEPQQTINMQLNANILLNHLEHVRAYPYALGKESKLLDAPILDINSSSNHGSYSFNQEINALRGMPNYHVNEVYEFKTLDSFRFANVRLIKVCTPGMELEVLEGAVETIFKNNFPPIIVETWSVDWYKEKKAKVLDFFASRAYEHFVMLGEHVMAFKTKAQHDYALSNDSVTKLGSFQVLEQEHQTSSVLQNQAALR